MLGRVARAGSTIAGASALQQPIGPDDGGLVAGRVADAVPIPSNPSPQLETAGFRDRLPSIDDEGRGTENLGNAGGIQVGRGRRGST